MAVIVGLPPYLKTVPPAPVSPDDEKGDKKRAAWKTWRDAVKVYRNQRHQECENDPFEQSLEIQKCRNSTAYFLTVWGHLFDPRKRKRASGYGGEFILFEKQVQLLDTMHECLASEEEGPLSDLAVPKSRDVGASWCMCGEAVKSWIFDADIQVGLVSYNEALVESKKPDSLFWKIDYLIDHLPKWMKPRFNDVHLTMTNLENGNVITGYTTTKRSARGGRATWIGYDESAFFEEFAHTWTGSTASADSRFAIGSISMDHGPDFYHLSMDDEWPEGDRPRRMAIDWWDHPLHDNAWLENERKRYKLDPAGFYREVLRNPFEGVATFVYPEARGAAADPAYQYKSTFPQYTTIDPGVRDDCAIVFIQEDPFTGLVHVIDSYMNSGKPADYYGTIITGKPETGKWTYDAEAFRIMDWTKERHPMGATTYGDVSGWNEEMATKESVYGRMANHGIYVIRDKSPRTGHSPQSKREATSHRGRREAMRELWPRLRFADTPGAMRVLEAFRMHRYRPGDQAVSNEESKPLHDWTSHSVSAVEFYAVNKRSERQIIDAHLMKQVKPSRMNYRRNTDTYARWEKDKGARKETPEEAAWYGNG